MLLAPEDQREQIDRILESETFHSSAVLRRLLRFLADKALSGEVDDLNEYSIGIDALGKPSTYDPRQDATVRLNTGRIRQKLGEYYRNEGRDDPIVVELPKGRYKLKWEARPKAPTDARSLDSPDHEPGRRPAIAVLAGALSVCILWAGYATVLLWRAQHNQAPTAVWTPELEKLWRPFLASKHPLVVAVADPLFVGLEGTDIFFRKIAIRRPEDATASPEVAAVRKLLGNPAIQPRYSYIPSGEVMSSFLLGRLLGTRKTEMSLSRGSQLLLRGLADNDVILIGPEIMFDQKLAGIQLQPELTPSPGGIRNLHPRNGEPEFFADASASSSPEDGIAYALISRAPGPLGGTNFESFTSSRTWGREGAIQAFTDPALAKMVVEHIRMPSGEIPRYFQMVLKVKFRDTVPISVSYVMHRVIAPPTS